MKINLLFCLVFLAQLISAQTFTEVMDTPFDNVTDGSVAFADVDGDNDQDVLITGRLESFATIAKLYTNDGTGNFTEVMDTPFEGVSYGSIAFADVDGDNDQDVLITGNPAGHNDGPQISKLYTNDGTGNFTEVDTPFEDVWYSSVAFADVDGDNDQDVLITGVESPAIISKLYTNDGAGNFTEVLDTPFEGVWDSSIAFADVDGDNDQDVLITGKIDTPTAVYIQISKLYINDGTGNFTEVVDTPFATVSGGDIAFADVDGDNDQDLFITGEGEVYTNTQIAKLYTNDGAGNFTEVIDTPFEGVRYNSIAFADFDRDNDQDLLIIGNTSYSVSIAKLYTNDGQGNFTEALEPPFQGYAGSANALADVDGDNDQDILVTGFQSNNFASKLYTNNSIISSIETLDSALSFEFQLYPNPTKTNTIHVNYDSKESTWVDVNIFDLGGRLLKQHQEHIGVGEHTFSINISPLNKGAYTIQLNDGVRTESQKFVVE